MVVHSSNESRGAIANSWSKIKPSEEMLKRFLGLVNLGKFIRCCDLSTVRIQHFRYLLSLMKFFRFEDFYYRFESICTDKRGATVIDLRDINGDLWWYVREWNGCYEAPFFLTKPNTEIRIPLHKLWMVFRDSDEEVLNIYKVRCKRHTHHNIDPMDDPLSFGKRRYYSWKHDISDFSEHTVTRRGNEWIVQDKKIISNFTFKAFEDYSVCCNRIYEYISRKSAKSILSFDNKIFSLDWEKLNELLSTKQRRDIIIINLRQESECKTSY